MQMSDLKTMFPRNGAKHSAMTGLIPMAYFVAHEAEIRAACKEYCQGSYRTIYRGPRAVDRASMTHRADAIGVLLYWKI